MISTTDKRIQFNNIVENQLPSYVKEDYPLINDFLKQYYIAQEFDGAPVDLIQNIDKYIKLDNTTNIVDSIVLGTDVGITDTDIVVDLIKTPEGTNGFPDTYGLIKIDDEIITYESKTITTFVNCHRGFCGITSFTEEANAENLVFRSTERQAHSKGTEIENLSVLFLKKFLTKTKQQILPGIGERELTPNLNQNVFIKQASDFYSSKGTDKSFKILFKALYDQDVSVIKPRDNLFTPSNANYKVADNFIVESFSGDPEELGTATLFQDPYEDTITKAYAPITYVEKVSTGTAGVAKTFYKLAVDSGYSRSGMTDGAIYGKFSVHSKTRVIGNVGIGTTVLDVDSTIGFPNSGELSIQYKNLSIGIVSYSSKSLTQFYGCTNLSGVILDGTDVGINTYAYGYSSLDQNKVIKIKINSVINSLDFDSDAYGYESGDKIKINTLGIGATGFKYNNWFYNGCPVYIVNSFELVDASDQTWEITLNKDHFFKVGDAAVLNGRDSSPRKCEIVSISSSKSFVISGQGALSTSDVYNIRRTISKAVPSGSNAIGAGISVFSTDIQNVYLDNDKLLVASPSIPSYGTQPLDAYDHSVTFSGTFSGTNWEISSQDHAFYTGDSIYYSPNKITQNFINSAGQPTSRIVDGPGLVDEGIYFIERVDLNTIKLAKSKSDLLNNRYLSIPDNAPITVTDNKIQKSIYNNKILETQKILREIDSPNNEGQETKTKAGFTGILINGVEILNYKSRDYIYHGEINSLDLLSNGSDYDVINPPPLKIDDSVGVGATGHVSVLGSIKEVRIVDNGFDYHEKPIITVSGGNGFGAVLTPNMKLIPHQVKFDATQKGERIILGQANSLINFTQKHKFLTGERIVYISDSETAVGGLSTASNYYVDVINDYKIRLHNKSWEAIVGLNTVTFTSYGTGNQIIKSYANKSVLESINIINPGTGYENKKRVTGTSGISTSLNTINISNHGYSSGERITYTSQETPVGGLTSGNDYYVTKVNEGTFKLSQVGVGGTYDNYYYNTNQYLDLSSVGVGTHSFNYPEIKVKLTTSGFTTTAYEAQVQPIVRGELTSVQLSNNGVGYGSSDIINLEKQPLVTLVGGTNAQIEAIVNNGSIVDILIKNPGKDYTSVDLDIIGNGSGAILTPIITNGSITAINIVEGGVNYVQGNTYISIIPAGSGANFRANLQSWNVNLVSRNINKFTVDDGYLVDGINSEETLQYSHLYAPRKLRERVFSVDQVGRTMYGSYDLSKDLGGNENTSSQHSPIIGWAYDGNPIYGPYGYITKAGGIIAQMKSGYNSRDAVSLANRPPFAPEGFFVEDYKYQKVSDETVLDENNGRFCVTPEFPEGVYAYFATVEEDIATSGQFVGYKQPSFPYLIGDKFKSKPNTFNFDKKSNQDEYDISETNWVRNTTPNNLHEEGVDYGYISLPNELKQTVDITGVAPGRIESIGIETGGKDYSVGDTIRFDNLGTKGSGASARVTMVEGKRFDTISVATSTITDCEIYPSNSYEILTNEPHNFLNGNLVSVTGLSTTSSGIEGVYPIKVESGSFTLVGLGTTVSGASDIEMTGIITYFNARGNFDWVSINDTFEVGDNAGFFDQPERIQVLNKDERSSRIRVLRNVNVDPGLSTNSSLQTNTPIVEESKKFTIPAGLSTTFTGKKNTQYYFDPAESVGFGLTIGLTHTAYINNPGAGASILNIATRSIYLPAHKLSTGDEVTYSPSLPMFEGVEGIGIATVGVITAGYYNVSTPSPLEDGKKLFVAKINENLIGLSTVRVGIGSTGTFQGLADAYKDSTTLLFTAPSDPFEAHSFKTNYEPITATVTRHLTTAALQEDHGLSNGDEVIVNVNPGVASTYFVKYNDFNRRLIVNEVAFADTDVNIEKDSITIKNHGFVTEQKVVYTAISPAGGLENNRIYYLYVQDADTIKLCPTLWEAQQFKPNFVNITSATAGNIGPINPPLEAYKDSTLVFDVGDSSLAFIRDSQPYSAFELDFFTDNNFTEPWNNRVTDIVRNGVAGINSTATVTITIDKYSPDSIHYNLTPLYETDLPPVKEEIQSDNEVFDSNKIEVKDSFFSGRRIVAIADTNKFDFTVGSLPEVTSYKNENPELSYKTSSRSAVGAIAEINIVNGGANYYSLPGITSVASITGSGAIVNPISTSIGQIKTTKVNDIGFDFPSDNTLRPTTNLPQTLFLNSLSRIESVGITSVGNGYIKAPTLLVFDGSTKERVDDIELKYKLGDDQVSVIKNKSNVSPVPPIILPINNTNGIGIATIGFTTATKEVVIGFNTGFSDVFPFDIGTQFLIENVSVGVGSTGFGFNSSAYDYKMFTVSKTTPNLGGIGSIFFNLEGMLPSGQEPGQYDPINSVGRVIPERDFPIFDVTLKNNDFFNNEVLTSPSATGTVESWNPITGVLKVVSNDKFVTNELVTGASSAASGITSSIRTFDSSMNLDVSSKISSGWESNSGFLDDNQQRIQDSLYYQNFSYSLKSRIAYDTWQDVVSTLNHTLGFKKYSDYEVISDSSLPEGGSGYYIKGGGSGVENHVPASMVIGVTTALTYSDVISECIGVGNLNCVHDFDLVSENSLQIGNSTLSNEIRFTSKTLTDYFESIGNRVLSIDDISPTFNSNPRPTPFSVVSNFTLADVRAQKYITYVRDKRYLDERQIMIVDIINDNYNAYISQYARVETEYDLGTFDFTVQGTDGQLLFYPTRSTVNDFDITCLSYNIDDNLAGIGTTTIGSTTVDTGSFDISGGTTTIAEFDYDHTLGGKVLVEITGSSNEYEMDELNFIVDAFGGIDIVEYPQITTDVGEVASAGMGTYWAYTDGVKCKIDFIPHPATNRLFTVEPSEVNDTDDTITMVNHRLSTGSGLKYTEGALPIGGLTSGTTYYVINVSEDIIQLATTEENAKENIAIDLTTSGTGQQFFRVLTVINCIYKQFDESLVGFGTQVNMKHARLESDLVAISASGTPTPQVIMKYPTQLDANTDGYDGAYFMAFVETGTQGATDAIRYFSEHMIIDDYNEGMQTGEVYEAEWGVLSHNNVAGLGTFGYRLDKNPGGTSFVEVTFTAPANQASRVTYFMNALKVQDDLQDQITFDNALIQSESGTYEGTHSDIKRAFNLTHNNYPIFEREFDGSDTEIISILDNTIKLPNHYFVTGEKLTYEPIGLGSSTNIGIATETIPGIGQTDRLPRTVYAVKVDEEKIKLASTAENALLGTPEILDITSVGIGTTMKFVTERQNTKVLVALDNIIQSPVVSTALTTHLDQQLFTTDNLVQVGSITSIFGGDLIKIGDEIMKVEGVGIGTANGIRVRRPWLGTKVGYAATSALVTKVQGNYNIVDNVLNFVEAPYGNVPFSSTTNEPDERDWVGIETGSSFQGRSFMRSGIPDTSSEAYSNNFIFDDISANFDAIDSTFTLKTGGGNFTGVEQDNAIVLINDIFQEPGLVGDYFLEESAGITSVTFVGTARTITNDVGISSFPRGGVIVSVGSKAGLGYQPLIVAGGTANVSIAGTIGSVSIGNSGSGYRVGIQTVVNVGVVTTPNIPNKVVSIGTATISDGHVTGINVTNEQVFHAPSEIQNVTYTRTNGVTTVTTINPHGLSESEMVVLSGIAFTCDYAPAVSIYGAEYDNTTGIMTVMTATSHGIGSDKQVIFTGLGMTCGMDNGATTHIYPRGKDIAYNRPITILDDGAHYTVSNATYDPYTGKMSVTTSTNHGFTNNDFIKFKENSISFRCNKDDFETVHSYPRKGDYSIDRWLKISNVSANGFDVYVLDFTERPSSNTTIHVFHSALEGGLIHNNGKITVDVGAAGASDQYAHTWAGGNAVDAIKTGGDHTHRFVSATSGAVIKGGDYNHTFSSASDGGVSVTGIGTTTPTDATYDAEKGELVLTIPNHGLTVDDTITFNPDAITFTCEMDGNTTKHSYPRTTDPVAGIATAIVGTSQHTVTVNVGTSPLVKYDVSDATYTGSTGELVLTIENHSLRGSSTFTISNAEYDPVSGIMTMTSAFHGLSTGDRIKIADNSITFRCDQDGYNSDHSYPRAAVHKGSGVVEPDPAHDKWLPVSKVDENKFAVRVVDNVPSSNVTTHLYQTSTPNGITKAGESVRIAKDSLTFTCSMDDYVSPHSYPRGTDPIYETSVSVASTTNNTVTLNVGVSTSVNYTVTNADYTASTGIMTMTLSEPHSLTTGTNIGITTESLTFTCTKDGNATQHKYPRKPDPTYNGVDVIGIGNLVQKNVTNATYIPSNGNLVLTIGTNHGIKINDSVKIKTDSLAFTCAMDSDSSTHTYPRVTDPIHDKFVTVASANQSAGTITLNVGTTPEVSHDVTDATYNPDSGEMELTIGLHTLTEGTSIRLVANSLNFSCNNAGVQNRTYPRASGANTSGGADYAYNTSLEILAVTTTTILINVNGGQGAISHNYPHTFISATPGAVKSGGNYNHTYVGGTVANAVSVGSTVLSVNIGVSTVPTFYKSGGVVQQAIVAPRAKNLSPSGVDPAVDGSVVVKVLDSTSFEVNSGLSTRHHIYARGGKVDPFLDVVIDEPLSYSNVPLVYSGSAAAGVGTYATADIIVGQGSSVISFSINNSGYRYGVGEKLTVSSGGTLGIPTTSDFDEFQLTVQDIFTDEFNGWSMGMLQTLDNVDHLFDSKRVTFPIKVGGNIIAIKSSEGSNINVEDTLLVFVNDILQVPGKGFRFDGGSVITFGEAPKKGDTSKILFYKGSGDVDVVFRNIIDTVKRGDSLQIENDPEKDQPYYMTEEERIATQIISIDTAQTDPYPGPGNTDDANLLRPVIWCRQTEDMIIDETQVGKARELYEPVISPTAYVTRPISAGSTEVYVDNLRPLFDGKNENNVDPYLLFQKKVTFVDMETQIGASATATLSGDGIISVTVTDGGVGYSTTPTVSIQNPIGIGSTALATATINNTGSVSGVTVSYAGTGYNSIPQVLIAPPTLSEETKPINWFAGDSGTIVGFGTTTKANSDYLMFDFHIPLESDLRDGSLVGSAITLSQIQQGDYFVVTNSTVGNASTSIKSYDPSDVVVAIGTEFVNNVYCVNTVENKTVNVPGVGVTMVRRINSRVTGLSTITFDSTGITMDNEIYTMDNSVIGSGNSYVGDITTPLGIGNYSWGKLQTKSKLQNNYKFYGANGIGVGEYSTTGENADDETINIEHSATGIHTSSIVRRFEPLRSINYIV